MGRLEYFSIVRLASSSADAPGVRQEVCRYDSARGQITVTSQAGGFSSLHGKKVRPSGRLLSAVQRPLGSSAIDSMSAKPNALAMMSLSAWCLTILPAARLHTKLCIYSISVYQCPALTWMRYTQRQTQSQRYCFSDLLVVQPKSTCNYGSAISHSPLCGAVAAEKEAVSIGWSRFSPSLPECQVCTRMTAYPVREGRGKDCHKQLTKLTDMW